MARITGRDFLDIDFIVGCAALVYTTLILTIPQLAVISEHFAAPAASGVASIGALTRWVVAIRTRSVQSALDTAE